MATAVNTEGCCWRLYSALPLWVLVLEWVALPTQGVLLPLLAHLQVSMNHSYFGDVWALLPPIGTR